MNLCDWEAIVYYVLYVMHVELYETASVCFPCRRSDDFTPFDLLFMDDLLDDSCFSIGEVPVIMRMPVVLRE